MSKGTNEKSCESISQKKSCSGSEALSLDSDECHMAVAGCKCARDSSFQETSPSTTPSELATLIMPFLSTFTFMEARVHSARNGKCREEVVDACLV